MLLIGCSTEKNTIINRTYHSTTAKYNGYWNARELLRVGLNDYNNNIKEDYYTILPIDILPSEEDAINLYPVLDTAISKCTNVISKHSMPTASKPSKKKTEYAKWIDQNWLLVGKANFYKRDYVKALDNFEFVRKFYVNRPSTYEGLLWKAKCQIELGEISEARRSIQILEDNYKSFLAQKTNRSKSAKSRGADELPEFPHHLHLEMHKTKAQLYLIDDEIIKGIEELQIALIYCKKKEEKARINFIIGQLLQVDNNETARDYFTETIRLNAPFEMSFHAKINRALAGGKSPDEILKELNKMTKEEKYLEYKDQIYFAMANVELSRNNLVDAKRCLTQSTYFSINNPRQKGISYEKLGDISFSEKKYVYAQKYFDSAAQVIPENYPSAQLIRSKANNLSKLVENVDIVTFEDSVQRIAKMSEKDRDRFLKDLLKQLKEEEKLRKEKEAQRAEELRELQKQLALQNQGTGSKWYWNNLKTIEDGFMEFRNIWGIRENEDDWRRSNKIPSVDFSEINPDDSSNVNSKDTKSIDKLTIEDLLVQIPLTDSALAESNERLLSSLYNAGIIYKDQLNEIEMSKVQFQRVIDHGIENIHNVLSAFQLYKIYEVEPSKSNIYKTYILTNFPESDYANYLRDPDYFIKKKELEAFELNNFTQSIIDFEEGQFYKVIQSCDQVITQQKHNKYRVEYMILKAMTMGKINADKNTLLPVLELVIQDYPESELATKAKEWIGYLQNGFPAFEDFSEFSLSSIYQFNASDPLFVLLFLNPDDDSRTAQTAVSDFNREFFSSQRLKTSMQLLSNESQMVVVREFQSINEAKEYIKNFERTKKHVVPYKTRKLLFISDENFKIFMREKNSDEYEKFFFSNY